jgi:GT2 family glycosyltransferase
MPFPVDQARAIVNSPLHGQLPDDAASGDEMKPVSVLVVIVNYSTPLLALDAAGALQRDIAAHGDVHVVIVDNGSQDSSAEIIAKGVTDRGYGHWCTVLPERRNGGFAAGNNVGIDWYRNETGELPEYAWLLNPDTIAEPGAMAALLDFMRRDTKVGIAGSRCLEPDGTVWASAFRFPSIWSELNEAVNFGPLSRLLRDRIVAPPPGDLPASVDWVSGTSMMVRRAVLESVGLMDEGYFLYFEETDYCARARSAGFEVWTVPNSRVTHIGGQATGVTGGGGGQKPRPRYWFASRARFLMSRSGLVGTHAANALWILGYPLGRMIAVVRGDGRKDPPRFWRDFLRHNYGRGGIMYAPRQRARRMGDGKADD